LTILTNTALEAMAYKFLIATVDYFGLENIIKGKCILCEPPIQDNVDELIDKLFCARKTSFKKSFNKYRV